MITPRYLKEHKRNEARLSVYHRLRYVEADNIVLIRNQ